MTIFSTFRFSFIKFNQNKLYYNAMIKLYATFGIASSFTSFYVYFISLEGCIENVWTLYPSRKSCRNDWTQTPNGDIRDKSAIILSWTLDTWKPRPANGQIINAMMATHLRNMIKVNYEFKWTPCRRIDIQIWPKHQTKLSYHLTRIQCNWHTL